MTSTSLRALSQASSASNPASSNDSELEIISPSPNGATSPVLFPFAIDELSFELHGMQHPDSPSVADPTREIDVRAYPQPYRAMFAQGPLIMICVGQMPLIELARPLFMATTTKPELLVDGLVTLPQHIEPEAVIYLIEYFKAMAISPLDYPYILTYNMDIGQMLNIHTAADALGMGKYTTRLYRKCDAYLHREMPTYQDLNSCTYFAQYNPRVYNRLFHIAAENMAVCIWEGTIPDPEVFNEYLKENVALTKEINAIIRKREAHFARLKELKHRKACAQHNINVHAGYEQGAQRKDPVDSCDQAREKWVKEQAEKAAKNKAYWETKIAENMEDAKSIQKKLTLSGNDRQFTDREKDYYRRNHGTQMLPKGC